jgi:hypothetical protein
MLSAMYDAVAGGDAKSFEPRGILHHPDVVWTDHRHMAINSNGLADIIERNRRLHELIPDLHLFVGNVGRIEPPFVAETIAFRGTTVEGADIDDGYAAVFELDVPTGLWARADLYEATDLETANRRVAELAADDVRLPRLNDAAYAGGWANSAAYAGDLDRFVAATPPRLRRHAARRPNGRPRGARRRRRRPDRRRLRHRRPRSCSPSGTNAWPSSRSSTRSTANDTADSPSRRSPTTDS